MKTKHGGETFIRALTSLGFLIALLREKKHSAQQLFLPSKLSLKNRDLHVTHKDTQGREVKGEEEREKREKKKRDRETEVKGVKRKKRARYCFFLLMLFGADENEE